MLSLFPYAGSKTTMIAPYTPVFANCPKPAAIVDLFAGACNLSMWLHQRWPDVPLFINEVNKELFGLFIAIRDDYQQFLVCVEQLETVFLPMTTEQRKAFYYDIRDQYSRDYTKRTATESAAMLYFLMLTCFNGVWRTGAKTGLFNTPFGDRKQTTSIFNRAALQAYHQMFQIATLSNVSFEQVTRYPDGSLLLLDPPYIDSKDTRYDRSNIFTDSLQGFAAQWAVTASEKHSVAFCNKAHPMFTEAFDGSLVTTVFDVAYKMRRNGDVKQAVKVPEILATNF